MITTLTPKIRVCVSNSCSILKVYDTNGTISTARPGGWGAANIDAANVDSAILSYTTPSNSTATDVDVTAEVNAQAIVAGEFSIADIDITAEDGLYSFVYTLTEGTDVVIYRTSIYSTCVVKCCVDKLWAKAAKEIADSEDCGCTGDKVSYAKKAMLAQATYNSLLNSASGLSTTQRDNLLKKLQRLCKLENCNCE